MKFVALFVVQLDQKLNRLVGWDVAGPIALGSKCSDLRSVGRSDTNACARFLSEVIKFEWNFDVRANTSERVTKTADR